MTEAAERLAACFAKALALTKSCITAAAQLWLSQPGAAELAISDWVATEFSSALSIKLRTGHLQPQHRSAALGAWS